MKKSQPTTHYVCQSCGHTERKWHGRCPSCNTWSSLVEERVAPTSVAANPKLDEVNAAIIAASDLVITLPERVARLIAREHPLRVVPLPIRMAAFEVSLAWHERVHHDPGNTWLRAEIVAALRSP